MQNREELRQKGHDWSQKTTCRERGKKYNFQKGGSGNKYRFRQGCGAGAGTGTGTGRNRIHLGTSEPEPYSEYGSGSEYKEMKQNNSKK